MDKWVEVHAILKAHAVNLEKIVTDLRLLSSGTVASKEVELPSQQVGSSIMPGKVNPVVPEFIVSSAHRIYANDQRIGTLSSKGCLELNAYLPEIGTAMLESLNLLISMNRAFESKLLKGLKVNEEAASKKLFGSPAVTTALSPLIGYNKAAELAAQMKKAGQDIFDANEILGMIEAKKLKRLMEPGNLLKKGFTMNDIRELL
jgi:aspartate ammonia-lyase